MASFIKRFDSPVTAIRKLNSQLFPDYCYWGFLSIPLGIGKWLEYYSTSISIQRFIKLAYPWWLVPTKQLQKTICNKRKQIKKLQELTSQKYWFCLSRPMDGNPGNFCLESWTLESEVQLTMKFWNLGLLKSGIHWVGIRNLVSGMRDVERGI